MSIVFHIIAEWEFFSPNVDNDFASIRIDLHEN